jgi:HEAT repeat protein
MDDQADDAPSLPAPTRSRAAQLGAALASSAAGRPLTHEERGAFSNLARDDESALAEAWSELSEEQRSTLVTALSEAERADVRLDYNAAYAVALRDPSAEVRRAAAGAIVEDPSARLLEPLLDTLAGDPSAETRSAAAVALAPYALRAEVAELPARDGERIRSVLLAAAESPEASRDVRSNALAALGYFSEPTAQDALRRGYAQPELRAGALRGIGRSADPRWISSLIASLGADDAQEREEAARAAGEIGDERAVSALVDAVDDPVTDVRLAVVEALGRIGGEEAREALLYVAEDPNAAVREAAERALEELELEEDPLG